MSGWWEYEKKRWAEGSSGGSLLSGCGPLWRLHATRRRRKRHVTSLAGAAAWRCRSAATTLCCSLSLPPASSAPDPMDGSSTLSATSTATTSALSATSSLSSAVPSATPLLPIEDAVPAHHASPVVAFIIGLAIVLLASILNAAGLNLTKLDHVRGLTGFLSGALGRLLTSHPHTTG